MVKICLNFLTIKTKILFLPSDKTNAPGSERQRIIYNL